MSCLMIKLHVQPLVHDQEYQYSRACVIKQSRTCLEILTLVAVFSLQVSIIMVVSQPV